MKALSMFWQSNDQAKPTSAATELDSNNDADALGRLERLVSFFFFWSDYERRTL